MDWGGFSGTLACMKRMESIGCGEKAGKINMCVLGGRICHLAARSTNSMLDVWTRSSIARGGDGGKRESGRGLGYPQPLRQNTLHRSITPSKS